MQIGSGGGGNGSGGQPHLGSSSGGSGGSRVENAAGGQTASGGAHPGSGGSTSEAAAQKLGESIITNDGLTVISYGGYLNGESFQQDGIVTHDGVQYSAFWNSARHVVLAARTLPDGDWSSLELNDYMNQADDAHNTISIGIAPDDASLHLAFDHHDDALHYRRSSVGLLDEDFSTWSQNDFGDVTSILTSSALSAVTYPRFVSAPDGQSLLLSMRIGASGSGTARLFEYETSNSAWKEIGNYVDGASVDENPYFHGIAFDSTGTRLHFAWCDRATPDATTNHDLFYAYSEDGGTTLYNTAGDLLATVTQGPLVATDEKARAVVISQDRGLINQEHMTLDHEGGVHILLSHLPDGQPSDGNFTSARSKSEFFHYYLAPGQEWKRMALGAGVIENFRGKLAVSSSGNAYAILPDLRIYGASRSKGYEDWALLDEDPGRFFSDPLVDAARLRQEDILTIFYAVKQSGQILALDYQLD